MLYKVFVVYVINYKVFILYNTLYHIYNMKYKYFIILYNMKYKYFIKINELQRKGKSGNHPESIWIKRVRVKTGQINISQSDKAENKFLDIWPTSLWEPIVVSQICHPDDEWMKLDGIRNMVYL